MLYARIDKVEFLYPEVLGDACNIPQVDLVLRLYDYYFYLYRITMKVTIRVTALRSICPMIEG